MPTSQFLPLSISGILPSMSSATCRHVVGLGLDEVLALGAHIGTPAAEINARASSDSGIRMATVSSPAVTASGTEGFFLSTMVTGPGIRPLIIFMASSVTSAATE